jgi:hypothetical protein
MNQHSQEVLVAVYQEDYQIQRDVKISLTDKRVQKSLYEK